MAAFEDVVLAWLRSESIDATRVKSVDGYGTDWAGDTFGGFGSEFDVSIDYLDSQGVERRKEVAGEDMWSLWKAVVAGYPDS